MQATVQSLGIDRMSVEQRMQLMEDIWDSIAKEPESVEIPDWHKKIIAERLADCESNPNAQVAWEEARTRLRESLARRRS